MSTEAAATQGTDASHKTLSEKGLKAGSVGLMGAVVIGVSCIAPAYTLTAALGPTVSEVGVHLPAIFLVGFIPMLLVALGYRELNNAMPDAGTSFTWATRAFGPWIGWMGGWGLIAATIIVLSNLAAVAVDFFYLMLSQLFGNPELAELATNLPVNIATTLVFIALACWISYRGMETTKGVQYVLVGFQLLVLGWFAVSAFLHVANGSAFDATAISPDWFNPFAVDSFSSFAAGVSLSIFIYWGWDVTLTMNEETRNPGKDTRAGGDRDRRRDHGHLHDGRPGHPVLRRRGRDGTGHRESGQPVQHLRRAVRAGDGPVRHPDVPGHPQQFGGVAAVHVCVPGPDPAVHGPLQGAAAGLRQGQPGLQVPELCHDRRGRCRSSVLCHHPDHLRERPVGHHHGAGHDDLLLLRHHGPGLRLVLPGPGVQQRPRVLLQVPGPPAGRRDPAGHVLQDRLRLDGSRSTGPGHPWAAWAWCSSWAWA